MTHPIDSDLPLIEDSEEEKVETPKPHPPVQKVSRFGNQPSKFGKSGMSSNPPMKQRPGRAAGRGR